MLCCVLWPPPCLKTGMDFRGQGWKRHFLDWNRVRILRTGRHTQAKNFQEYPSREIGFTTKWNALHAALKQNWKIKYQLNKLRKNSLRARAVVQLKPALNSSLIMSLGAGALKGSGGPNEISREEVSNATLEAGTTPRAATNRHRHTE